MRYLDEFAQRHLAQWCQDRAPTSDAAGAFAAITSYLDSLDEVDARYLLNTSTWSRMYDLATAAQ